MIFDYQFENLRFQPQKKKTIKSRVTDTKSSVSKSIVHVIKHAIFQLYRRYSDRVVCEKLMTGDKYIKNEFDVLHIKRGTSKITCKEERIIKTYNNNVYL